MNLGINKEEARLINDALTYFFKKTQFPDLLSDLYLGADIKSIFTQLKIIMEIGDNPITEKEKNLFIRSNK